MHLDASTRLLFALVDNHIQILSPVTELLQLVLKRKKKLYTIMGKNFKHYQIVKNRQYSVT